MLLSVFGSWLVVLSSQSVASVLIDRGRLHLPELCHYTRLRARTVQSVLIVLLQHNLLWRSELPFMGALVEFFEVDLKECLLRCRWARMLAMTESEFGDEGVQIVREIMVRGKAKVGDVVEALGGSGGSASETQRARRLHRQCTELTHQSRRSPRVLRKEPDHGPVLQASNHGTHPAD